MIFLIKVELNPKSARLEALPEEPVLQEPIKDPHDPVRNVSLRKAWNKV